MMVRRHVSAKRDTAVSRLLDSSLILLIVASATPVHATSGEPGVAALPPDFTDSLVLGGLNLPLALAHLPDGRLLFTEREGRLRYMNGTTATTVLNISSKITLAAEGGLLGLAVDPDFPARPYLYFDYTLKSTPIRVQIARYTVNVTKPFLEVDWNSELLWISNASNSFGNHYSGTLRFDGTKRLIVSRGDDWHDCYGQDPFTIKGKLLRIRVDPGADPSNPATLVPLDNPFASSPNVSRALTFVEGLRNPFRFDVDKVTGDVIIGDVGPGGWEEVDVAQGGENMGWPYFEGNHTYQTALCPGQTSIPPNVKPVYEYPHSAGSASVIGMMAYRGVNYGADSSFPPAFNGTFFFVDFYQGFLRAIKKNPVNGSWDLVAGVSASDFGTGFEGVTDMRVGPDGAAYYARMTSNEIRKITYQQPSVDELSFFREAGGASLQVIFAVALLISALLSPSFARSRAPKSSCLPRAPPRRGG